MSDKTLSQRLRELQRFLDQGVGMTALAEARQAGHEILLDCIAQAEAQEQECEAMCGDYGGIEGCSCSECSAPLGPIELCAYCNGCGRRVKWPLADGAEYREPSLRG